MLPDIGRRNTASSAPAERAEGLDHQFSRHGSRSNFLLASWPVTMWTLECPEGVRMLTFRSWWIRLDPRTGFFPFSSPDGRSMETLMKN